MFWRVGKNVPSRLLLLDTPDVDSDVAVNWARARAIRQVSDVLIAVLTQQKYNDAAVKQFFREAAAADKPILVIFNQCDLEADAAYWPQWLGTFTAQTDVRPEHVYVVPSDRKAAENLRLPFYDVGPDGRRPIGEASDLRNDLASLHFDAIKIRTFRGALSRLADPKTGVAAYLASIREASEEFSTAVAALSAREMARVAWPPLPAAILVDEIRAWWDAERAEWSRRVHGFYRKLGRGVTWPVRAVYESLGAGRTDPLELLHNQERQAIVLAIENLLDELERLAEVGNDTLRPRLTRLLSGNAREKLLEGVREAHLGLPAIDSDYRTFLREGTRRLAEIQSWSCEVFAIIGPRCGHCPAGANRLACRERLGCGRRHCGPCGRAGHEPHGRRNRRGSGNRRRHYRRRRSPAEHDNRGSAPSGREVVGPAASPLRSATGRMARQLAGAVVVGRTARRVATRRRSRPLPRHLPAPSGR